MRFYSTSSLEIITGMYAINDMKKSNSYSVIFKALDELGVLANRRYLTTDFELAIQKGYRIAIKKPITFRFCYFHLVSATRKYASSINKTISIENRLRNRPHCSTTAHIFHYFSFLIFIRRLYQFLMFYIFKFIIRSFAQSLANELFIAYFGSTYIYGPLSHHFVLDFTHTSIITNNFVEGLNSSLKRHNRGRVSTDMFLNWMRIDSKKIIMNLSNPLIKETTSNPKFNEFHSSFESQGNFLSILTDHIDETIRRTSKMTPANCKRALQDNKDTFSKYLRSFQINWSEQFVWVTKKLRNRILGTDRLQAREQNRRL